MDQMKPNDLTPPKSNEVRKPSSSGFDSDSDSDYYSNLPSKNSAAVPSEINKTRSKFTQNTENSKASRASRRRSANKGKREISPHEMQAMFNLPNQEPAITQLPLDNGTTLKFIPMEDLANTFLRAPVASGPNSSRSPARSNKNRAHEEDKTNQQEKQPDLDIDIPVPKISRIMSQKTDSQRHLYQTLKIQTQDAQYQEIESPTNSIERPKIQFKSGDQGGDAHFQPSHLLPPQNTQLRQVETNPTLVSAIKKPSISVKPANEEEQAEDQMQKIDMALINTLNSKPLITPTFEMQLMKPSDSPPKSQSSNIAQTRTPSPVKQQVQVSFEKDEMEEIEQTDSHQSKSELVLESSSLAQSCVNSVHNSDLKSECYSERSLTPLATNVVTDSQTLPKPLNFRLTTNDPSLEHIDEQEEHNDKCFSNSFQSSNISHQSERIPEFNQTPNSARDHFPKHGKTDEGSFDQNDIEITDLSHKLSKNYKAKSSLQTKNLMMKLPFGQVGGGLRRMHTNIEKIGQGGRLQLPIKRKNSHTSKNSEASRHRESARRAKAIQNSKYGRSEKSYLTFAPKQINVEEYNLKAKNLDEDFRPKKAKVVSKKIYSKDDFKKYPSLKSIIKPRMIALIKSGREVQEVDKEQKQSNSDSDQEEQKQEQPPSQVSEPFDSESDSVYSHIKDHFLESNESINLDMKYNREAYHMKPAVKIAPEVPDILSPRAASFCSHPTEEFTSSLAAKKNQNISLQQRLSMVKRGSVSTFDGRVPQNIQQDDQEDNNSESDLESATFKSQTTRKGKAKPPLKKRVKEKNKENEEPSYNIRDEVSISDDDDKTNMLIAGMFLYYFPQKNYFIVHTRKVYGYTANSFNKLGYDNIIRQLAIWINEWPWFDRLIIGLIIFNSLGLGMLDYQYSNMTQDHPDLKLEMPVLNHLMEEGEVFFTIVFAAEMFIKMIAMGLFLDKNCYLRDAWNVLDFVVVLGSLLAYLPGVDNVSVLRTFRLFKPLRSLKKLPAMKELVVTLLESVYQLTNIFFLLEFATVLFAILGLQIWRGLSHFHCRTTEQPGADGSWAIVNDDYRTCGAAYMCDADSGQVCGTLYDSQWEHIFDQSKIVDISTAENNWSITNFDNIFQAYVTMFQATTLEGWYSLMSMIMNGYQKYITITFFISAIQICHYLLVNLTLAVMVCNLRKQKEDEFDALIDRQIELQLKMDERKRILQIAVKNDKGYNILDFCRYILNTFISFKDEEEPSSDRYDLKIVMCLWRLAIHPIYIGLYLILVLVNVFVLASFKHREGEVEDPELQQRYSQILLFSNFAFVFELIVKLVAFDLKVFFEARLNIVDLILLTIFIATFIVDQVNADEFSLNYDVLVWTNKIAFISGLRALRIILVARASETLKVLLDCVAFTLDAIGNFFALLTIFLYVFSLLGMQMFAGRLRFDEKGLPIQDTVTEWSQLESLRVPRSNFDNIIQSFITVFQILMGEKWNEIFYDCWRGGGTLVSSGYFISLIFFGNIIMMNLFLAMLLGNFERASLIQHVNSVESELDQLMPTSTVKSANSKVAQDLDGSEDQQGPKSILKKPSDFKRFEEKKVLKRRNSGRLKTKKEGTPGSIEKIRLKTALNNQQVDSSFDSEQDLQEVRQKYKTLLSDSHCAIQDRRTSFVAYANDNFFDVPAVDEKDLDFRLNHFYDEPSPDLFMGSQVKLGVRRPRNVSFNVNLNSTPFAKRRRTTAIGDLARKTSLVAQNFEQANMRQSFMQSRSDTKNLLDTPQRSFSVSDVELGQRLNQVRPRGAVVRPRLDSFKGMQQSNLPYASLMAIRNNTESSLPSSTPTLLQVQANSPRSPLSPDQVPRRGRLGSYNELSNRGHVNSNEDVSKKEQFGRIAGNLTKQITLTSQLSTNRLFSPLNPDFTEQDRIRVREAMKTGTVNRRKEVTLQIQTGSNPKKEQEKTIQKKVVKKTKARMPVAAPPIPGPSLAERFESAKQYARYSSMFIFHKSSKLRRFLITIAHGGIKKPHFKTIEELFDFYSQSISKKKQKRAEQKAESPMEVHDSDGSESSGSDESEKEDVMNYQAKSDEKKFLEDHNSSAYIEEVVTAQQSPYFSVANLRDQTSQIRQMQESGHYDHIFIGNVLKHQGMFYLTEKHEIKIFYPKWYHISANTIFITFMNFMVIVSSLALAFDGPFEEKESIKSLILENFDICITVIFFVEAMIKIIANGCCKNSSTGKDRKAYLQCPWNRLDFVLIIVQLLTTFQRFYLQKSDSLGEGVKALRAMRALRPLRMVARFKGLRIAMNTIVNSGQQIFNVVAVSCIVILVFSIFSVHMFRGMFWRCVIDGDTELAKVDDRIDSKQDCLDLSYQWENTPENFDDILSAVLNLIVFMTNEGWVVAMHQAVDSRGVDLQPKKDARQFMVIYFIVYMVVSHVFILNLFVGVIIQRFNSMHEIYSGYTNKPVKKRKWVDIQRLMMKQKLETKWFIPESGMQRFFALICLAPPFEIFIYLVIVGNVIVLAMPYHGMSDGYSSVLDNLSFAFSVIYNVEAFIKLMGLRMRYFHDRWNTMDLLIVISSNAGFVLELYTNVQVSVMIPVIRALRVARILKLLKGNSGLTVLIEAISTLFVNLINILGLLFLLVFIFAILGMNIFNSVMYREHYNEQTNFRSFDNSVMLLVRCVTGEGWNLLMVDLTLDTPYKGQECIDQQSLEDQMKVGIYGCGSPFAYVFFFTFVVLSQMVFINLFIAFVLQAYLTCYQENNSLITSEHYAHLTKLWSEYDPKACGLIDPQDIAFLVFELVEPLGRVEDYQDIMKEIVEQNDQEEQQSKSVLQKDQRYVIKIESNMILPVSVMIATLSELSLPVYIANDGHKCHFKDVCIQLTKKALAREGLMTEEECIEDDMLLTEWQANYEALKTQVKLEDQDSGSFWAGLFIARLIKQMQVRRKYKTKKAECISEFNKRKEYSKMLRRKEEDERIELEVEALKQVKGQKKYEAQLLLRKYVRKQVQFANEEESDDSSSAQAQFDFEVIRKAISGRREKKKTTQANQMVNRAAKMSTNYAKNREHGQRDINRSSWWKDPHLWDSSNKRMQQWIKINDIRYGIEEQKEQYRLQKARRELQGSYQQNTDRSETEHNLLDDRSIRIDSQNSSGAHNFGEMTPIERKDSSSMQQRKYYERLTHQIIGDQERESELNMSDNKPSPKIQISDLEQEGSMDLPQKSFSNSLLPPITRPSFNLGTMKVPFEEVYKTNITEEDSITSSHAGYNSNSNRNPIQPGFYEATMSDRSDNQNNTSAKSEAQNHPHLPAEPIQSGELPEMTGLRQMQSSVVQVEFSQGPKRSSTKIEQIQDMKSSSSSEAAVSEKATEEKTHTEEMTEESKRQMAVNQKTAAFLHKKLSGQSRVMKKSQFSRQFANEISEDESVPTIAEQSEHSSTVQSANNQAQAMKSQFVKPEEKKQVTKNASMNSQMNEISRLEQVISDSD